MRFLNRVLSRHANRQGQKWRLASNHDLEERIPMFIFKKHIPRRTVLKGAGVTLALPFLEAMVPATTALAQTAAAPKLHAGFFYIPHGAVQHDTKFGPEGDKWTP